MAARYRARPGPALWLPQRTAADDDRHLDSDAVFGVRVPLVLPFAKAKDRASLPANLAARETLPLPVWTATIDLVLP